MKDKYLKLLNLRKSLEQWEHELGLDKLPVKSRLILECLVSSKKLPRSLSNLKDDKFLKNKMSIATFNRCINDLLKSGKIKLSSNPDDRRSQLVDIC
tara:strand:+ start:693 stop:983 length:291 start_codon:yes stop_codon:yes gene_type:complete